MAIKADMLTQIRLHGLPEPQPEYEFARPERKWRFDWAWPSLPPATGGVALEREGASWTGGRHTRGQGFRNDCIKYNEAGIRGWLIIRVTVDMIRDGSAILVLRRALESRGII